MHLLTNPLARDPTPGRPVPASTQPSRLLRIPKKEKGDRPTTPVPRSRISSPINFPFTCEIELVEMRPPGRGRRSSFPGWTTRQIARAGPRRDERTGERAREPTDGRRRSYLHLLYLVCDIAADVALIGRPAFNLSRGCYLRSSRRTNGSERYRFPSFLHPACCKAGGDFSEKLWLFSCADVQFQTATRLGQPIVWGCFIVSCAG